jgi:hypothetical protein
MTFAGYVINLIAVPAMALAGNWQVAAALILAERVGRALVSAVAPLLAAICCWSASRTAIRPVASQYQAAKRFS